MLLALVASGDGTQYLGLGGGRRLFLYAFEFEQYKSISYSKTYI